MTAHFRGARFVLGPLPTVDRHSRCDRRQRAPLRSSRDYLRAFCPCHPEIFYPPALRCGQSPIMGAEIASSGGARWRRERTERVSAALSGVQPLAAPGFPSASRPVGCSPRGGSGRWWWAECLIESVALPWGLASRPVAFGVGGLPCLSGLRLLPLLGCCDPCAPGLLSPLLRSVSAWSVAGWPMRLLWVYPHLPGFRFPA
jgi:hypothetical protein